VAPAVPERVAISATHEVPGIAASGQRPARGPRLALAGAYHEPEREGRQAA